MLYDQVIWDIFSKTHFLQDHILFVRGPDFRRDALGTKRRLAGAEFGFWYDLIPFAIIATTFTIDHQCPGITGQEILFGHVITQFLVMTFQTVMVLIVAFGFFKITCEGDILWVTALTILTGWCGMCFGEFLCHLCLTTNCTNMHVAQVSWSRARPRTSAAPPTWRWALSSRS